MRARFAAATLAFLAIGSFTLAAQAAHFGASGGLYISAPGAWYGGIGLVGTKIVRQDGGPELLADGAGLSLYGGLRLGSQLSLEAGWMESFHNPALVETYYGEQLDYLVVEALTLDVRILGRRQGSFVPYFQGGLGLYALSSEYFGTDSVGSGFQLGGGAEILLGPVVSLGGRALYRGIAMGPPHSDVRDTFVSAVTGEIYLGLRSPR
ncbi:MAG: outer membrane beta-barrel protein [Myxococcota bacterium]